jgi:hypothetical protein
MVHNHPAAGAVAATVSWQRLAGRLRHRVALMVAIERSLLPLIGLSLGRLAPPIPHLLELDQFGLFQEVRATTDRNAARRVAYLGRRK